jgi:hypothetical protein
MILTGTVKAGDHGPDLQFLVELRGFEPLTPSMRMRICRSNGFGPISHFPVKCQVERQMTVSDRVAQ